MYAASTRRRAFLLFVCLPLAVLVFSSGQGCPGSNTVVEQPVVVVNRDAPPVVTEQPPGTVVVEANTFGIDLVNDTLFEVDPGVQVNEFPLDLGTLAALEGTDLPVAFDVDCFAGDTLTIEPVLFLTSDTDVLTANGPIVLEEGVDYVCGDIIRLEFSQHGTGAFFVDVFVNDVLVTPPVVTEQPPGTVVVEANAFGIDLVNNTLFEVDPGVQVDEFPLDLGTLAALEGTDLPVAFDVDCFAGDTLTIEPVLFLTADTQVLSANGPIVLEEGVDYSCGDIIRLEFSQDGTGAFFVDVFVNDVLVNP